MADDTLFLNPRAALSGLELHQGLRVADLAAGSGFFARAAAELVAPGEVWAIDPDSALLARLKHLSEAEGLRNIEVMQGDIERKEGSHLPAASYDVVLLVNALFAARHKERVAAEAHRIVKRGGRALLVDWSGSHGGLGPHPDHVVGKDDACKIFEAAGFLQQGTVHTGAYHWGVILRKK